MNTMTKRETKQIGYAIAVVTNVIMWYVINNLLNWNIPFITPHFVDVIRAFNLSVGATAVANALFIIYDPGWFHHLVQMALNVLAFNAAYVLYTIFPFAFNNPIVHQVFRVALIFAMVGTAIAFITELVKLVTGRE